MQNFRVRRSILVVIMSTVAFAQSLKPPVAITDPKQITAKASAEVEQGEESLSLQRLYMTRAVGDSAWSPDGKTICFVSNITGRNNLWLVPASGGWPLQLTVSDQRQSSPAWAPDGKWVFVANGLGSNLSALGVGGSGKLSPASTSTVLIASQPSAVLVR